MGGSLSSAEYYVEQNSDFTVGICGQSVCIWLAYDTGGECPVDEFGSIPMHHGDHQERGHPKVAAGKLRTDGLKGPIMDAIKRQHRQQLKEVYKTNTKRGKAPRLGGNPWAGQPAKANLQIVATPHNPADLLAIAKTAIEACKAACRSN